MLKFIGSAPLNRSIWDHVAFERDPMDIINNDTGQPRRSATRSGNEAALCLRTLSTISATSGEFLAALQPIKPMQPKAADRRSGGVCIEPVFVRAPRIVSLVSSSDERSCLTIGPSMK